MNRYKIIAFTWIVLMTSAAITSCNNNPPAQRSGTETTDPKEKAEDRNDTKFTQSETERDAQFLVDAYSDGLCEIEAGKQAVQFSSDKSVKDLASSMIAAHVNMNDNIKKLADRKQISVQKGLSEDQLDGIKKLKDQKGRAYSLAYLDKLIEKHKDAITLYEKAAEKATDPDIRNFFSTSLAELRKHSDMAMNVKDKLKK
jgi:putative membrane protein